MSHKGTRGCPTAVVHTGLSSLFSFISETIKERSYFQREGLEQLLPLMRSERKKTNWNFLIGSLVSGVKRRRL